VRFIDRTCRVLRPSGDVEQFHQVLSLEEKMQPTDLGMPYVTSGTNNP
jgi:hypothetical protein